MSYYTRFSIGYRDIDKAFEYGDALCEISPMCFCTDIPRTLEDLIEGDYIKWYSAEKDMIELSKRYPDEIFTLTGDGEDYDDRWRAYFHKGREQYVTMCYPPFDPNYFV